MKVLGKFYLSLLLLLETIDFAIYIPFFNVICVCIIVASPDSVKFLLQVRTGDAVISRGTTNSSYFRERVIPYLKSFTDCALAMEAKIAEDSKSSPAPVVWYLMSDLVAVREYMTSKFDDKILSKLSCCRCFSTDAT